MENDTTTQKVENTNKVETVQIEKKALIAIGAIVVALILLTFGVLGYQMMLTLNSNKINNVVSSSSRSDSVATLISRTSSSSAMESSAVTSSATSNSANVTTSASSTEQGASDNKYYKYETNNGQYIQFDHPVGAKVEVDGGDIRKESPQDSNKVNVINYKGILGLGISYNDFGITIDSTVDELDRYYGGYDGYTTEYRVYYNDARKQYILSNQFFGPGEESEKYHEYLVLSRKDFDFYLPGNKKTILSKYNIRNEDSGDEGFFVVIQNKVNVSTGKYIEEWRDSLNNSCCLLSFQHIAGASFYSNEVNFSDNVYVDGYVQGYFPGENSGYSNMFSDYGKFPMRNIGNDVYQKDYTQSSPITFGLSLRCNKWSDEDIERCVEIYNTFMTTVKRLK
jgi:hypothetical protein